jgi:O-antigen ligase
VAQNPAWGVGVYAPAQAGLVVSNGGNLYIHDEYLQTWARYGAVGLVALLALLAALVRRSWALFVGPPEESLLAVAGLLLLAFPASLVFFPQFSSLARFDVLLGLMAGVLPAPGARARSYGAAHAVKAPSPDAAIRTALAR